MGTPIRDPLETLLRKSPATPAQRAALWDAFEDSKDEDELAERLKSINVHKSVKAQLWDMKLAGRQMPQLPEGYRVLQLPKGYKPPESAPLAGGLPEGYRVVQLPKSARMRQLPVMAGGRPVGMRPATEEEYQKFQAENVEGAQQLLGLAATATLGPVVGAVGAAPGIVGAASRLASNPAAWAAVSGGAELLRSGDPMRAAGAAATGYGGSRLASGTLRALGHFLKRAETARTAAAAAKATEAASKLRTGTAAPMAGRATTTPTTPSEVIPFPTRPATSTTSVPAPAPVARTEAPSTLEEQLRQSIAAVKNKTVAPKAVTAPLTPAQETMRRAKELEARVVQMRTELGFSKAQAVAVLKEQGILERGTAKTMVDMIWKAHGLQ